MPPEAKRSTLTFTALAALALLAFALPGVSRQSKQKLDLHEYGFPANSNNGLSGVFYLSNNRVALFFDQQLPSESPHDRALKLMVFDTEENHPTAQLVVQADPKAMDMIAGPSGGVLFRREGEFSIYDSNLQLLRSIPVARDTTGVRFDRSLNQLVIMTVGERSGQVTAHFKDGNSLEESAVLSFPIRSRAVFGKDELVYDVPGYCKGGAHVVSARGEWHGLEQLPACDALTFVGDESLAYAVNERLYVVDSKGEQRLNLQIPAPETFQLPGFVGLSDNRTRLALRALQKQNGASGWPYYNEVFVYDLASKRMIFEHALEKDTFNMALSPDGRQLAVIEKGVLTLLSVR